jgi:L-threonylcarbamoyladenylate synthase
VPPEILLLNRESAARAARVVRDGGLIVYPTDTVYGLGCDPFDESAVRRLFEAKGRSSKPVSVLCSSTAKAEALVELSPTARRLAESNWPGAFTIVAPLKRKVPPMLAQGRDDLGVRVPAHDWSRRLISTCGGWLTGTSANISGRPSARTALDAANQLGASVGLVLDGGRLQGTESTVVRVVGAEVTILRTGPIGVGNERGGRRTS